MASITFYPMSIGFKALDASTEIRIFGRRSDGRQICVIDKSYSPHFYVILREMDKLQEFGKRMQELKIPLKKGEARVVQLEVMNKRHHRRNREAIKVIVQTPYDIYPISRIIGSWPEVEEVLETDLSYTRKYAIERGIAPHIGYDIEGDYETRHFRVPVFLAKKIRAGIGDAILPRPLFFDIKTQEATGNLTGEEHPIVAVSLFGNGFERTLAWKRFHTDDEGVEFLESEAELIERLQHIVEDYQPDFVVGFLSERFDLPYLLRRAQKYRLKFDIGLDFSGINPGKRAEIHGIGHLDLSDIVKRILARRSEFELEDIDSIAREILQEEIFSKESSSEIEEICRKSREEARLYSRIYEKFLPFLLELVKLTGFDIEETMNMNPFLLAEWHLIRSAAQKNLIVPNKVSEKQATLSLEPEGSTLVDSEAKIHRNIFSLDMRNMVAALTAKRNISYDSKRCADCKGLGKDELWFCQTRKGLIPEIVDDLISRKSRIKDILSGTDETKKTTALIARFEAISILVHAFSRYIASSKSRFYDDESASVLSKEIDDAKRKIMQKSQEKGYKIIYFDRDFLFLSLGSKKKDSAHILAGILNDLYSADLDVEGVFGSGFFVERKKGKKFVKYALSLPDGTLRTRNFELTQRSSGLLARDAQEMVLRMILEKGDINPALRYLQETIANLRRKEYRNRDIIVSNDLQKDIEAYDTEWPYVAVAKRMREKGIPVSKGSRVQYIVVPGKERTSERARMPDEASEGEYDSEYYINAHLVPAVSDIFEAFGISKESLVEVKEQTKLDGFFG